MDMTIGDADVPSDTESVDLALESESDSNFGEIDEHEPDTYPNIPPILPLWEWLSELQKALSALINKWGAIPGNKVHYPGNGINGIQAERTQWHHAAKWRATRGKLQEMSNKTAVDQKKRTVTDFFQSRQSHIPADNQSRFPINIDNLSPPSNSLNYPGSQPGSPSHSSSGRGATTAGVVALDTVIQNLVFDVVWRRVKNPLPNSTPYMYTESQTTLQILTMQTHTPALTPEPGPVSPSTYNPPPTPPSAGISNLVTPPTSGQCTSGGEELFAWVQFHSCPHVAAPTKAQVIEAAEKLDALIRPPQATGAGHKHLKFDDFYADATGADAPSIPDIQLSMLGSEWGNGMDHSIIVGCEIMELWLIICFMAVKVVLGVYVGLQNDSSQSIWMVEGVSSDN
ncbi:uncharacterized protein EI90DRAFT_3115020 [Cantharellus anzutake]|uniref:uncharacterized protein n=1 Tax=Cantharellus anzutake TaxID=1750568 RepID=UPI0019040D99|nr:uncharacterized protein EI90DRAFT_3115020 [Cantharellus anzutake]KAF8344267.1 hypothetical protein EI90DRAFT_3115020 [Cantharellus anzutake]